MRTGDKYVLLILSSLIIKLIIRVKAIIYRISGLCCMKFTRTAVQTGPAVIINPVRNVGRLLNLQNETALSYRMDTAGRKEEHISLADSMLA